MLIILVNSSRYQSPKAWRGNSPVQPSGKKLEVTREIRVIRLVERI